MKRITRWSPDTCGCVLDYKWDDAEPEASRTHGLEAVVKKCPAHSTLTDQAIYNQVLSENTRKNKVLGIAQRSVPKIKGDNYNWSFDDKRMLKVGFINVPISATQLSQISSVTQQEIGTGLVEVI